MRKKYKALFVTAIATTICLISTGCGTVEVDLNNYVEMYYEGYDTIGSAAYDIDYSAIIKDYPEAFRLPENASQSEISEVRSELTEAVSGSLNVYQELTNGDEIDFSWDIDNEAIGMKYPVTFNYSDMKFTVSGLEELKEFDPFDYIEISFSGIAPDGQLLMNVGHDIPLPGIEYYPDRSDGLRNGDTVTIRVGDDNLSNYCLDRGYEITATEKQYTVDGLAAYAMTIGEIPEALLSDINKQAEDTITAYYSERRIIKSIKSTELLGHWLLTEKEGFSPETHNTIYCIYKVTGNVSGYKVGKKKDGIVTAKESYYAFVKFSDIKIMPDGNASVELANGIMVSNIIESEYSNQSIFNDIGDNIKGYKTLDDMFNACVTSHIDEYNYESTID